MIDWHITKGKPAPSLQASHNRRQANIADRYQTPDLDGSVNYILSTVRQPFHGHWLQKNRTYLYSWWEGENENNKNYERSCDAWWVKIVGTHDWNGTTVPWNIICLTKGFAKQPTYRFTLLNLIVYIAKIFKYLFL